MPLTNPTAGDVHVNRPLTNFSQKFLQSADAFVAARAWPNRPVTNQSDSYYTFDRGDFYRDEMEIRADGAPSAGGGFGLSTATYFCDVYAYHKDVTDRQRSNADPAVNLDVSATHFVTHKGLIKRERVMATSLFAGSIWFNGGSSASAGQNVNWTNASSPTDPVADVRAAIRGVHAITGYRPNRVLMGRQAYDTCLDNDDVVARISGGATSDQPAKVMRELLASLFEVDEVLVMDAVVNTGARAGTDAIGFVGGDQVLVYYAPTTLTLDEPTAGAQFSWTGMLGNTSNGLRIKRFRMEELESDRIEIQASFDFKVVAPELGHLMLTPSAA